MQDDKKRTDEPFPFIQEKIVPKKKSKGKKLLVSIITTFLLAILFGVVASIVMYLFEPAICEWFGLRKETGAKKQIIFSTQTPVPTAVVSPSPIVTAVPTASASGRKQEGVASDKEEVPGMSEQNPDGKDKKQEYEFTVKDYERLYVAVNDLASQLDTSLVTVSNVKEETDFFNNEAETADSFYGLVIADNEEDILILTSYGRIKDAKELQVIFSDGSVLKASVYGTDEDTGIAVLAVSIDSMPEAVYNGIKVAVLGDSYYLAVGTPVIAVGSPNGYVFSVETGLIMNKPYEKYITDSRIDLFNTDMGNHALGEGVVVNLKGEVIGVITHDFMDDRNRSLNVAIGISRLKPVIEKLVNQEEQAYFGIMASDITTEVLKNANLENGIYITEVVADSPALRAGIQNGDVLLSMDGKEINSVSSFAAMLQEYKTDDRIRVKLCRTAKSSMPQMEVEVELKKKE